MWKRVCANHDVIQESCTDVIHSIRVQVESITVWVEVLVSFQFSNCLPPSLFNGLTGFQIHCHLFMWSIGCSDQLMSISCCEGPLKETLIKELRYHIILESWWAFKRQAKSNAIAVKIYENFRIPNKRCLVVAIHGNRIPISSSYQSKDQNTVFHSVACSRCNKTLTKIDGCGL